MSGRVSARGVLFLLFLIGASARHVPWQLTHNARPAREFLSVPAKAAPAPAPSLTTSSNLQARPTTAQEKCLIAKLSTLPLRCSGGKAGNSTALGPRDALVKMLQECLAPPSASKKAFTLSIVESLLAARIGPLTAAYSNLTGIPVSVETAPLYAWYANFWSELSNANNRGRSHDAWIMLVSSFIGDGVRARAFQNLTSLVALDTRLGWSGLLPILRDTVLLYDSEVVSLPIAAYTYQLMYRKDLFARYNLTLPRTWQELVDFSRAYNGTAGKYAFCGQLSACFGYGATLLTSIFNSLLSTRGLNQGWVQKPENLPLAFNSSAAEEALRLFKALPQVSATDESLSLSCPLHSYRFAEGQCLMTIQASATFKYMSHVSRRAEVPVQGNVGFAPWPGSERVLDWSTNSLVPCTPDRCPYATRYTNPNGSTTLVNVAPYVDSVTAVMNANTPEDLSFFGYSVLSYLTSQSVNDQLMYDPDIESSPTRTSQLDVRRWVAAGYNAQDAAEFVASYASQTSHPNVVLVPRYPGAAAVSDVFNTIAARAHTDMPSVVLGTAAATVTGILQATYGSDLTRLTYEYYASLNRARALRPAPPSPRGSPQPTDRDAAHDATGGTWRMPTAGLVLCAILGSLVMVIVPLLIVRRYGWLGKSRKSVASAPGVSPFTTICITDIEDSTNMWEEMEAQVVDTAVKLHNVCLRGLVAEHGGYESMWEGDSFIIAFHDPKEALAFCMEAQQALLHLPWPSELLGSSRGEEVWCMEVRNRKPVRKQVTFVTPTHSIISEGSSYNEDGSHRPSRAATHDAGSRDPSAHGGYITPRERPTSHAGTSSERLPVIQLHTTVADHYSRIWQRCASTVEGAVLAYRGLRVRMGLHSGVDSEAMITFNTTMQRVHYSGPIRITSNAVASAGHGGHTMMNSDVARLLDPDSTGTLPSLPCECGVFYMGQHTLAGVEAPQDLLLALPDSLQCRLSVQQAPLRTVRECAPGTLAAPIPSNTQSDPCALVFVRFSGVSELLAWNQEQTLAAVASAATCLRTLLADMGGCLSEDGLQHVLDTRSCKTSSKAAFPDSCTAGQVVAAFSGSPLQPADQAYTTTQHSATTFALQLRNDLLMLDWHPDLLSHEQCKEVGMVSRGHIYVVNPLFQSEKGDRPDRLSAFRRGGLDLPTDTPHKAPTEQQSQLVVLRECSADLDSPPEPRKRSVPSRSRTVAVIQPPTDPTHSPPRRNVKRQSTLAVITTAGETDIAEQLAMEGVLTIGTAISQGHSSAQLFGPARSSVAGPVSMSGSDRGYFNPSSAGLRALQGMLSNKTRATPNSEISADLSPGRTSNMGPGRGLLADMRAVLNGTVGAQYEAIESEGLRGLRCRMAVVRAQGARFAIATRSSGRVVYLGAPVKEALRILTKSRPGVVTVDKALLGARE